MGADTQYMKATTETVTRMPVPHATHWLLSLYLGVAPIYWLPDIELLWWRGAKIGLFGLAIGSVLLVALTKNRLRLPGGLAGPLGFAALVTASLPGLVQTPVLVRTAMFLMDVAYGAVFLWCFYNVARYDQGAAQRVLMRGVLLMAGFVALALAYTALGLSGWQAPCGNADFATTGLACNRVEWSNALALYLCIALAFAVRQDLTWDNRCCHLGIALILLVAQVLSGGRGGLVASVMALGVFAMLLFAWRTKLLGVVVLLGATALIGTVELSEDWQRRLRIDALPERPQDIGDWDYYSAGRVGQVLTAVEAIRERPLTGYGIGVVKAEFRGEDFEIHNLWLKWATNSGLLAPLLFGALIVVVLRRAWGLVRSPPVAYKPTAAACGLIVVAGLGTSLFEGEALIGEFQNTALWWAALGIVLGMATNAKKAPTVRPRASHA